MGMPCLHDGEREFSNCQALIGPKGNRLFVFRNKINFLSAIRRISARLNTTEGDAWIRIPARAAAVADT
jgi:hypothetical protein